MGSDLYRLNCPSTRINIRPFHQCPSVCPSIPLSIWPPANSASLNPIATLDGDKKDGIRDDNNIAIDGVDEYENGNEYEEAFDYENGVDYAADGVDYAEDGVDYEDGVNYAENGVDYEDVGVDYATEGVDYAAEEVLNNSSVDFDGNNFSKNNATYYFDDGIPEFKGGNA